MRVEIKARNNAELIMKLNEVLNDEVTEVYINLRPTKEILVRILERAPNVRKISCPPSLYPKVSKKAINALAQMGIELVPEGYPRGRPRKYDERTIREVYNLIRKGITPKEISSRMGIPLRTVYYMIEQIGARQWKE
ncbi:DUF1699 domain-containing protein [Thermococcus sp. GR7]|uniref:DUF1699 family protein n=1 Tax=unclassified Thermococcus TaxID=2627626 RepID=UPI00142F6594|nr:MULTISPECIES: DUF1699 family protein [unclassified Thermococcus]NJE47225.1 DUF1699 domain-containing protein [Thermococcus sp. GR7]NJE79018.1 DUF1699 domain-containing protein [Thermococcus sp. GR4]NJF22628.1 DUF1699 domain-containing protein [Thermococcus sp. GR5]